MSESENLKDILKALRCATANDLLNQIKKGGASASTLNVARQLLKDNGYDSDRNPGEPARDPVRDLAQELSFDEKSGKVT